MDQEEHGHLKAEAWRTLVAVDHVDAKAADEGLTISPAWRSWRTEVRKVIRGERMDIPAEPERYAGAAIPDPIVPEPVAAPAPEPVASKIEDEIPIDLARFTEPDESIGEARIRLLQKLADMRSMISGRIEMSADEWTFYNILESQAAQSWLNKRD